LRDGQTEVVIDPESQAGVRDWRMNGLDHLKQEWYWIYGDGDPTLWWFAIRGSTRGHARRRRGADLAGGARGQQLRAQPHDPGERAGWALRDLPGGRRAPAVPERQAPALAGGQRARGLGAAQLDEMGLQKPTCTVLGVAMLRSDERPKPPDWVTGKGLPLLQKALAEVYKAEGCSAPWAAARRGRGAAGPRGMIGPCRARSSAPSSWPTTRRCSSA
jgi:hypothetical protein